MLRQKKCFTPGKGYKAITNTILRYYTILSYLSTTHWPTMKQLISCQTSTTQQLVLGECYHDLSSKPAKGPPLRLVLKTTIINYHLKPYLRATFKTK